MRFGFGGGEGRDRGELRQFVHPPGLREFRVHLRQAGHHAVGLQCAEHEFRIADLPPHRRFQQRHHARLQHVAQGLVVGVLLRPVEFRRGGRSDQIACAAGGQGARAGNGVHCLERDIEVERIDRSSCRGKRGQRRAQRVELAGLGGNGLAIVEIGIGEQRPGRQRPDKRRCRGAAPDPGAPAHCHRVERPQSGFAEDNIGEEIAQEEAALFNPWSRHGAPRGQAEGG